jgi:hypothetical protein
VYPDGNLCFAAHALPETSENMTAEYGGVRLFFQNEQPALSKPTVTTRMHKVNSSPSLFRHQFHVVPFLLAKHILAIESRL